MALFSIFSKQKSAGNLKAKSSRQSVAPTPSISSAPSSNLLELKLVSPLLLSDATPTLIGDTIPSTPSTPGLVGASPWISVDALEQDEKVRERASLDKEREEKRLGRAVLELGSVIELMQECGGVIRERGKLFNLARNWCIKLTPLYEQVSQPSVFSDRIDLQNRQTSFVNYVCCSSPTRKTSIMRKESLKISGGRGILNLLSWLGSDTSSSMLEFMTLLVC